MAALDPSAIAALAYYGGITNMNDLVTAVAISLRESGGDPTKHNDNASTGDNSYGLWQENVKDNPDRFKPIGLTGPDLLNPLNAARALGFLYKQSGFYAWGPYKGVSPTNGVTAAQMAAAAKGVQDAQAKGWLTPQFAQTLPQTYNAEVAGVNSVVAGASGVTDTITGAFSSVGDLISALGRTIFNPTFWKWVGLGALGVMLILAAVSMNKSVQTGAGNVAKGAML